MRKQTSVCLALIIFLFVGSGNVHLQTIPSTGTEIEQLRTIRQTISESLQPDSLVKTAQKSVISLDNGFTPDWDEKLPALAPQGRRLHAMVYDSVNEVTVLFGGLNKTLDPLNDTWLYDSPSETWKQVFPKIAPSNRYGYGMVFDPKLQQTVLFGGTNGTIEYDDTWSYDVVKNTWTKIDIANAPSPRRYSNMVYDPIHDLTLLYGGWNGSLNVVDTWAFNSLTGIWTNRNPSISPTSNKYGAFSSFDVKYGKFIIFGGCCNEGETWAYDYKLNSWSNLNPINPPSPRRGYTKMVYDPVLERSVLYGGYDSATLNGTYEFDYATNKWSKIPTSNYPGNRWTYSIVYDTKIQQIILFGGSTSTADIANGETWHYTPHQYTSLIWTETTGTEAPKPRRLHSMVYDTYNDQVVLFGGRGADVYNDTWVYDTATHTWADMAPKVAPTPRFGHIMVYDIQLRKIILFGGDTSLGAMNDTWTYDLASNTWENVTPVNSPPVREYHAMVYDPIHGITLLYGGSTVYTDTWSYNSLDNTWTQLFPTSNPGIRIGSYFTYDTYAQKMLLYGGLDGIQNVGGTWAYDYPTNTWSELFPTQEPSARRSYGQAMIYDQGDQRALIFGGITTSAVGNTSVFDYVSNSWTQLTTAGFPDDRYGHAMAYDSNRAMVVLFGGTTKYTNYDGDTWVIQLSPPIDTEGPQITFAPNVSMEEGEIGKSISWTVYDANPATFTVYVNGIPIDSPLPWESGQTITVSLNGLQLGDYTYTLVATDQNGNSSENNVQVIVTDSIDPTLTNPNDLIIARTEFGVNLTWVASDAHPANYTVTRNGTLVQDGLWVSDQNITLNLDDLLIGNYTFQIIVQDTSNNSISDDVFVSVLMYGAPEITPIDDLFLIEGDRSNKLLWYVFDDDPTTYTLSEYDKIVVANESWVDKIYIEYDLSTYSDGFYNFTLTLYDNSSFVSFQSVGVQIFPVTQATQPSNEPGFIQIDPMVALTITAGIAIIGGGLLILRRRG